MACNFEKTVLNLLSATNYSLDNLKQDQISSFENLPQLKPLLEWLSQNLSETNCITPEELEEFKKLEENGKVKYGEVLEEALQSHLSKGGGSPVPFKESLYDTEQELTLVREQLHYEQMLHEELCSLNAAMDDELSLLSEKKERVQAEQKEVITSIFAATNTLKENVSEVQESVNELRDDIMGLSIGSPDVSADEGIHSLTSETINPNTSVRSFSTASSWQTIRGKDTNIKYLSQLSFDKYQQIHKRFLKHLTKLLDAFSKVGRFYSKEVDHIDLHMIKERLEKQMCILIEKESELEGIRAGRVKIKELYQRLQTEKFLTSTLKSEKKKMAIETKEESLNLSGEEELHMACQQWAECKALCAVEQKMREKIELSKCLIEKMDELLKPLMLKLNVDKILHELLQYEKERVEMSVELYKLFHNSLLHEFDQMKKRIDTMQNNLQDFEQFCSLPLEERNDLVEQLALIVFCDQRGVVQAVQHLNSSSQREHEARYEHYVHKRNKVIVSGNNGQELQNSTIPRYNSNEVDCKEAIVSIERSIGEMNNVFDDAKNDVEDVIATISNKTKNM